MVVVRVPSSAEVWIQDQKLGQNGEERKFVSPTLPANQTYSYDVRATYPNPLNEEAAWKVGYSTALYLQRSRQSLAANQRVKREDTIVVGRDMRPHSPDLAKSLSDGIRSAGMNVIDVGVIDTSFLVPFAGRPLPKVAACDYLLCKGANAALCEMCQVPPAARESRRKARFVKRMASRTMNSPTAVAVSSRTRLRRKIMTTGKF